VKKRNGGKIRMKKKCLTALVFSVLLLMVLISGTVFAANTREIALNENTKAVATDSERDVYEINLSSAGKLNINFKHANLYSTDVSWRIDVYAADLETVLQTVYSTGVDTNLTGPSLGLSKGKYYITVYSANNCKNVDTYSDAKYTLKPVFKKKSNWEVEWNSSKKITNNEQAGSKAVSAGKVAYGTISDKDDVDFYKVKVKKNGYITLNFTHKNVLDSNICWRVELVNSKTSVICSIDSKGTKKSAVTPKIGVTAGTYFIKVYAGDSVNTADYGVKLNFKAASNWEKEFNNAKSQTNNSMATANSISTGKAITGTLATEDDVDYYTFKVNKKRNVKITLEHVYKATRAAYYQITVYDKNLNQVTSFKSRGINESVYNKLYLKKGTYFVKVEKGTKYNKNPYTLTVK
jgi:hypothetical protein